MSLHIDKTVDEALRWLKSEDINAGIRMVERLTARVNDLEVELERLKTELATAQALAGTPATNVNTGTCSGEPPVLNTG